MLRHSTAIYNYNSPIKRSRLSVPTFIAVIKSSYLREPNSSASPSPNMVTTPSSGSSSGLAPFIYPSAGNKLLQTYYRVFGDLESSVTPLVVLHGGPGFPHNYLLNISTITEMHSIPVIFYDQIGSGLSTRLPGTASTPSLWDEEIFFEQLRQLLTFLGIEKNYDILSRLKTFCQSE